MTLRPPGLTILITNNSMTVRSGTIMYVKDLALRFLALGHRPIVYSPQLGAVADELLQRTVPVVDDLAKIGVVPDVIHGHHHPQTMMALAHFPHTPALFVSHDWSAWQDVPPLFPRILRYCAVDQTCLDKLIAMNGVPESQTRVLYNAVDLNRFQPRGALPPQPQRAAIFTNYRYDITPVRAACARLGIALDEIGGASGAQLSAPENTLGQYDLVFAKARAALEAMAVGCAVVVCDFRGVAGLVRAANFDALRRLNFGARSLQQPHDTDYIAAEIGRYNAADAAQVSESVRQTASLDALATDFIELYTEVIEQHRQSPTDVATEGPAMARYLRDWGYTRRWQWEREQVFRRIPAPLVRFAKRLLIRG